MGWEEVERALETASDIGKYSMGLPRESLAVTFIHGHRVLINLAATSAFDESRHLFDGTGIVDLDF